ncbi:MAG: hypothetical protein AAF903_04095 [Pseudomonadota bacterium]
MSTAQHQNGFTKLWVRILIFMWAIVFPIIFVALPVMKMLTGEAPVSTAPVFPLVIWFLSPLIFVLVTKAVKRSVEKAKGGVNG